jgi:hypothetical protein
MVRIRLRGLEAFMRWVAENSVVLTQKVIANAGTYEFNGSTLTIHAMVAKNQERMTTASKVTYEIKLEAPKNFWLIPTADRAASDPRVKFTRLE